MRGYLRSMIGLCLSLVLAGCVISSSPSPSKTLVMYPGDTMTFSVLASKYTNGYLPPIGETETEWSVDHTHKKSGDYRSSFDYTAPASPGRHKVRVDIGLRQYCIDCPTGSYEFESMQSITWNIDVNGVIPQPADSALVISPNTAQTFTVQAWPEGGSYTYVWYLDGVPQTGVEAPEFTYAPVCADAGDHTLTVKASGWEQTFPEDTWTWNIHVPASTPVPSDSHLVRHPGETLELAVDTCADPAAYSYVWYVDDQIVSGAESLTFAYTQDTLGCRIIKVEAVRGQAKDVHTWHVDFSKADAWVKPLAAANPAWDTNWRYRLTHTADGAIIMYPDADGDVILVEFYDLNGTCIRSMNYGASMLSPAWISVDLPIAALERTNDGGYILVGLQTTTTNYLDVYASKIDGAGQQIWQKSYVSEATNNDCYLFARQTPERVYIIGVTWGWSDPETRILKIDAGGSLEKILSFDSQKLELLTADGGFILYNSGSNSITQYDQDGLVEWSVPIVGLDGILETSTAELFAIAGDTLYKLSSHGAILWAGDGYDLDWPLCSATMDGGFIQGYAISASEAALPGFINHGEDDAAIIKYDSNAEIEQCVQIGGSINDSIRYIEQAPDGSYVAIGYTYSTDFPGMLLPGYFIMHLPQTW